MTGYRIYTPLPPIPVYPEDEGEDSEEDGSSHLSYLDEKDLYKRVRQGLRKIVKAQTLSREALGAIEVLSTASSACLDKERGSGLADFMSTVNFVRITQKIVKNHFEEALVGDEEFREEIWSGVYNLLYIVWNLSDKTSGFCQEILDSRLYVELLRCLKSPHLNPDLMDEENPSNMVQCILSILHNLVQKIPASWPEMRNNEAVEVLQPFRECSNQMLSCLSLMVQAYIINEEDNEKINSGLEIFKFFTQVLVTTMEGRAFYSIQFSIIEIIEVINKLAVNDSNKKRIVEAGVLPYYVTLMKGEGDWDSDVIAQTARGIWILGFKCKEEIMRQEGCLEALRSLLKHSDPVVKEKASGALWILEKQDILARKISQVFMKKDFPQGSDKSGLKTAVESTDQGHIFISYQWDSKSTVLKVRDRLRALGFKTWLDEDDMSGSVLEAMATAVEKASTVIICLSQKYKESPNCRTEAEYTFRLRKKVVPLRLQKGYYPDGWLGLIVGSKLVFDVSQETRYEDSIKHLIKELSQKIEEKVSEALTKPTSSQSLTTTPEEPAEVVATQSTQLRCPPKASSMSPLTASIAVSKSLKQWKDKEVLEWLNKNKLQKYRAWFKDFDGSLLQEYAYMLRDAPEAFYNHLFRHNLNIRDALAIGRALRELSTTLN